MAVAQSIQNFNGRTAGQYESDMINKYFSENGEKLTRNRLKKAKTRDFDNGSRIQESATLVADKRPTSNFAFNSLNPSNGQSV